MENLPIEVIYNILHNLRQDSKSIRSLAWSSKNMMTMCKNFIHDNYLIIDVLNYWCHGTCHNYNYACQCHWQPYSQLPIYKFLNIRENDAPDCSCNLIF